MKEKVIVGLSGGVDSAVAAWCLKEQGYDVTGATVQTWQDSFYGEKPLEIEDARRAAETIGIPHIVVDGRETFLHCVVDPFASEYASGCTPNPCILCNRAVKWGALLSEADRQGAAYIATGHYAGIVRLPNGRLSISFPENRGKDQSYVLSMLTQEQLSRTLMPLCGYEKTAVREIAASIGLHISEKKDSQEICFIPDNDHPAFLARNYERLIPGPGNFVDRDGKILGPHRGIVHYTIGQRKHLNLAMGHPVFVTGILPETNEVVIGENEELFSTEVRAGRLNYMGAAPEEIGSVPVRAKAKIRYAHREADCTVTRCAPDQIRVLFDEPVRAATRGQTLVVYRGDIILLAGVIQ